MDLDISTSKTKSCGNIDDLVVPLERNLYGHPLAGFIRDRKFEF